MSEAVPLPRRDDRDPCPCGVEEPVGVRAGAVVGNLEHVRAGFPGGEQRTLPRLHRCRRSARWWPRRSSLAARPTTCSGARRACPAAARASRTARRRPRRRRRGAGSPAFPLPRRTARRWPSREAGRCRTPGARRERVSNAGSPPTWSASGCVSTTAAISRCQCGSTSPSSRASTMPLGPPSTTTRSPPGVVTRDGIPLADVEHGDLELAGPRRWATR